MPGSVKTEVIQFYFTLFCFVLFYFIFFFEFLFAVHVCLARAIYIWNGQEMIPEAVKLSASWFGDGIVITRVAVGTAYHRPYYFAVTGNLQFPSNSSAPIPSWSFAVVTFFR